MPTASKYVKEYDRLRGNIYLRHMADIDPVDKCPENEWPSRPMARFSFERLVTIHDKIRLEIKREDDLINQRNTWCILFSTALSAGFMALSGKAVDLGAPGIFLCAACLFSVIGIVQSVKCLGAVTAAKDQIEYLFCIYLTNKTYFLRYGLFRPFGRQDTHNAGIRYSQAIPLINICYWAAVLLGSMLAAQEVGLWSTPSPLRISL